MLEDIKKMSNNPSQVLAILEFDISEKKYSIIRHVAKGLNLNNISLSNQLNSMISLENYVYKGK